MFRIGEFSKLTQVSVRMLRYYDEIGLLKPAETDRFTGYRLYSADQVEALSRIVFLRDLGFQVSEITDALRHWEDGEIERRLERKRLELERTIAQEQERLAKIRLAKQDLRQDRMSIHCAVSIKAVPACRVLSLRRVVPDYYAEGPLWAELSEFAKRSGISLSGETFTIYHDDDFREADVDMEVCAPTNEQRESGGGFVFRVTEPVPQMASMMVRGPFDRLAGAYRSFAAWLQEHGQFQMTGHSRQTVHRGPWNEPDPEAFLTEIQIPLERR
ncbi:hypothetical protein SDC9_86679 [bioreactor metagenome]|uniref:HTH merR-type domain-containing protein n=1 Tax=bioreactor metagenome TaxID=1076179 RepID=A0A644ZJL7_9ZZZZ